MLGDKSGQIRVRTQDEALKARKVPIPHLQVAATTSGTADTLLTVRSGVLMQIHQLRVANITGTVAALSLNSIPSGGSIGDDNAEFRSVDIPANTSADLTNYIGQMYDAGTVIKAYSDTTNALVISGWAEEIL